MKIFITCPSWEVPHGGIRIILEWANRLAEMHQVYLYNTKKQRRCHWFRISHRVSLVEKNLFGMDCLIITSPHSIDLVDEPYCPKKVFIFMQMLEHLFHPDNRSWIEQCKKFYTSPHPLICISTWNALQLRKEFKRQGKIYFAGNGVNENDFPISLKPKTGNIILVEGWESNNPTKDPDAIGPEAACNLKKLGFKIWAFSAARSHRLRNIPDQYFFRPNLRTLNFLYEQATILIKATKYDARACAPMEAMTKGTPTARAIIKGDDDLIGGYNCLRCGYNAEELFQIALHLMENELVREELRANCYAYLKENTWDTRIKKINEILTA